MTPLLKLNRLSKKFSDFTAVNSVSLEVYPGEIFGFLGPNGAGKTTTIKMIAGLLLPTSGEVEICGRNLHANPAWCKSRTGYIPDRPFIYEKLTGREYLEFIASLYTGGDAAEYRREAEHRLELFDLTRWLDHLIEGYSHGMRQKLIMASIFMLQTPLMVVDEPMVGLDPKSARIVKEMFKARSRRNEGGSIFLSTHSMEIAEELCDRIAIIVEGNIAAVGTVEELRQSARNGTGNLEDIFFQLTGAQELQAIIDALRKEGDA